MGDAVVLDGGVRREQRDVRTGVVIRRGGEVAVDE
jgi:hypothetical protein